MMSLTVTPKFSKSNIENNQMQMASMKAKKAVKAIKLDRIPPIGPTMFDAPTEIASKTLFASLKPYIKVYAF